jgi:tetratricopeptide (TPR) repeat protein
MKHVACLIVVALAACSSCKSQSPSSDREPPPVTHTAEPSDAIDQKLMVALSQARNLHHKARIYTSNGDTASAIAAVREILALHFPPNAPEAEDVRNDARALLARLLVGQGNLDEAMNVIAEGLAQSQRESFFVANLYTVKGEILEARATAADADPANKAHVVELRHAAIEAYDASNKIDKKLQDQLTESQ